MILRKSHSGGSFLHYISIFRISFLKTDVTLTTLTYIELIIVVPLVFSMVRGEKAKDEGCEINKMPKYTVCLLRIT